MATCYGDDRADRWKGAVLALAVQAAILLALVRGLGVAVARPTERALQLFHVLAPRADPPPPPPRRVADRRPRGAASAPNLRSRATPVAAPVPVIALPPVPVVVAAARPAAANDPTSGAAPVAGPGTGSGGRGDGTGSGSGGDGSGDGEGDYTPPWRIGGSFDRAGYPVEAARRGEEGTVGVRFVVDVDGRVSDCRVTRSSGSAVLDAATCRVIRTRFRYRPSLDPEGRPVRSQVVESHEWILRRDPASDR